MEWMRLKILIIGLMASFMFSCSEEEDPLANLIGSWTFGSCFVDGAGVPASGNITFSDDFTGSLNVTYRISNFDVTRSGTFSYKATTKSIVLNEGSSEELTFNRRIDKPQEQEWDFIESLNGVDYEVTFDLIPN